MFVVLRKRLALQAAFFIALAAVALFAQSDDLAAESHRAKELMAQRRFAEAVPIYEGLVKAIPGNAGLLLNLALAEQMAGEPARAIPHFQAVLKAQPGNVPALASLSMARLQLNQPGEAIPPLKKLLAVNPGDKDALGMLAGAEMSERLFGESAKHYRELSALDGADSRAWYGLGKAYEALAARAFEQLSKRAPESPYVAVLAGDTRLQRRQYRSAFFFYREAQSKLPDLPEIHAGLALVYRNTEHADWAEEERKREAGLATANCRGLAPECAFRSGRFLEAASRAAGTASPSALFWATKAYNQLALQAFDRLGQLPESVEIHALKAQIFHDHQQELESANEWRAALKLAPEDARVKRELAAALFDAKDYRSAIPLLQEQLAQQAKDPDLNYLMGASLWRTEQPEKALSYLQLAVQSHTEILPAEAALGLALVSLNKNAEAIPHLKKALALDDDGSMHYSLARAYRAAGQTQLAAGAMQQYQAIQKQNQEINGKLAKEAEIAAPTP